MELDVNCTPAATRQRGGTGLAAATPHKGVRAGYRAAVLADVSAGSANVSNRGRRQLRKS
jgi:hypothetical protein